MGVLILRDVDSGLLKIAITSVTILLTIVVASNARVPMPRGLVWGLIAGFVVSVTLNALGIGGPIMALFIFAQRWTRNDGARRAISVFPVVETAGVIGYAPQGC